MNRMKQTAAILLTLCMLFSAASMLGIGAVAEDAYVTEWDNGELTDWKAGIWYDEDVPLSYEYYFLKVLPTDERAKGFYPMTKATTGAYAGMYTADETAGTSGETSEMRTNLYECYVNGPYMRSSAHYLAALTFTAPYTGTVEFTYQYKCNNNQSKVDCTLVVANEQYSGSWVSSKNDRGTLAYHEVNLVFTPTTNTISVDVQKGDKIYFIDHADGNRDYDNLWLWMQKIEYTHVSAFTPNTASVIGKGLATTDELLLRFFVQCDNNTNPNATVTVKTPDGDDCFEVEGIQWVDTAGTGGKVVTEEDYVFYYTVPLSAKQMMDEVKISLKNKGGEELLKTNNTYSVSEYCNYWINNYKLNSTDQSVAKVCAALTLYGRSAQISLNYNTEHLPEVDTLLVKDILENGLYPDGAVDHLSAGAQTSQVANLPEGLGEGFKTVQLTAAEMLENIRFYRVEENTIYEITDGESITFNGSDRNYFFDLKNSIIKSSPKNGNAVITFAKGARGMHLKNAVILVEGGAGGVSILENTTDTRLTSIHVIGNTGYGFSEISENVILTGCTVSPAANGSIASGVLAGGKNLTVTNSRFKGLSIGVKDQSNGAVIENNVIENCETGVLATSNTVAWYNTVTGGTVGIQASFAKSEISAAESEGYNVMAAMNRITGATSSILFEKVSNGVVLLNVVENATVTGGVNMYVNENVVNGMLTLTGNNYLIANGNIVEGLVNTENQNVNGDNLTDLTAREERGVKEELLPHINEEQFVGMAKKTEVANSGERLNVYIGNAMKTGIAIVPPGAYYNDGMAYEGISDATVYAYGVYAEIQNASKVQMAFTGCENVEVKGIFLNINVYPHIQGSVTKVTGQNNTSGQYVNAGALEFIPDPGYNADLTNAGNYLTSGNLQGRIFRANGEYAYSIVDTSAERKYTLSTNTNTLTNVQLKGQVQIGDRIAFRGGWAGGITFSHCSEMKLEDVTIFSAGGFAESDSYNDEAPTLHRYAVKQGPAPLLDSSKTYADPNGVTWKDAYGRLRSAKPLTTTIDATHSSAARKGIQIISCLFESMEDDAGNINSYYGLASSYDASSNTLVYSTTNVNGYSSHLPVPFRVGDQVILFDWSGKLIAKTKATSVTQAVVGQENYYQVKLADDVDLGEGYVLDYDTDDDGKIDDLTRGVVIQNGSASGNGFLVDNVLQKNSKWSCFRIKATCTEETPGIVKNSTFQGVVSAGMSFLPQWNEWPEVGYATNIKILNNEFIELCSSSAGWNPWEESAISSPFIIGGGTATTDVAYCLHENIEISGNLIDARWSRYAFKISSVKNLKITDNVITARTNYTDATDTQAPILILGGYGIYINNNTFPSGVTEPIEYRGVTKEGANVTGNNAEG